MTVFRHFTLALSLALILVSCANVPLTGRRQLLIISTAKMQEISFAAYRALKKEGAVVSSGSDVAMVRRVGNRMRRAVERYFLQKGKPGLLSGYQWEFTLFQNQEPNAFCMDGGKVGIHTGILPITQTEDGLAAVMGHEIAHAVASHGRERASQNRVAQMGSQFLLSSLSGSVQDPKTTQIAMTAYGLGAKYGALLPFSRMHEAEADHMGIIFLAMAGYDPHAASQLWVRMQQQFGGAGTLEFMSTHPSNQSRIENLRKWVPEAMTYKGR